MFTISHFIWPAAVVIGVLSVARTARLIIYDEYPPMVWLRIRLLAHTPGKWTKLWECPFCLTPYLMIGMTAWGLLSDFNSWWWIINGTWGLSYLAAILVAYDQPED